MDNFPCSLNKVERRKGGEREKGRNGRERQTDKETDAQTDTQTETISDYNFRSSIRRRRRFKDKANEDYSNWVFFGEKCMKQRMYAANHLFPELRFWDELF